MTVKSAFKYIFLGLFILLAAVVIYTIQAGIAIVSVRTPESRIWVPVPVALGHLAGKIVTIPMLENKEFREFLKYREEIGELMRQLPGLPDADFVEVQSKREQVRIFKRGDSFCVNVNTPEEKVNIRLPVETIERLVETFDDPNPNIGDLIACFEWQNSGDLIHVKTNSEEVRVSIW